MCTASPFRSARLFFILSALIVGKIQKFRKAQRSSPGVFNTISVTSSHVKGKAEAWFGFSEYRLVTTRRNRFNRRNKVKVMSVLDRVFLLRYRNTLTVTIKFFVRSFTHKFSRLNANCLARYHFSRNFTYFSNLKNMWELTPNIWPVSQMALEL